MIPYIESVIMKNFVQSSVLCHIFEIPKFKYDLCNNVYFSVLCKLYVAVKMAKCAFLTVNGPIAGGQPAASHKK